MAKQTLQQQLESLSRKDLIAKGKEAGMDRPANCKSAEIIEFLIEASENRQHKGTGNAKLDAAKDAYAEARARVRDAVAANKKALDAYRAKPTDKTKAAYDEAKAEHKAAIDHIKEVRAKYHDLREKFEEASA